MNANGHCISIPTLAEIDGETWIWLGFNRENLRGDLVQRYSGRVLCPSRVLSVLTAENEDLLSIPVSDVSASITVLTDRPAEPTKIAIVVG